MPPIETEIEIAASVSTVWDILLDWERYPEWNPYIPRLEGRPEVGAQLHARFTPPWLPPLNLRPVVYYCVPECYFSWRGNLLNPLLFNGEHYFDFSPLGRSRCHLRHGERLYGAVVALGGSLLARQMRAGFVAMNEALRTRAESPADQRTRETVAAGVPQAVSG